MIIFNYKITDFTNNAKVLSIYRASSSFDSGKENTVGDIVLKESDESFLKKYLKIGVMNIAQVVSGYTKDLTNSLGVLVEMVGEPVEFNVAYESVADSIVFRLNMPETFNLSILSPMDESIKDCLENYMLYRTSKLKGLDYLSYQEDYEQALGQIRTYINRRTKGTVRNYNLI